MADAAAAATLHRSPTLRAAPHPSPTAPTPAPPALSSTSNPVPANATRAKIHVRGQIALPNKKYEKNGTSLMFRYSSTPERVAVIVSRPTA